MAGTGKKLINRPEDAVEECLEGFSLLNRNVLFIKEHKIIIRQDIEALKEEKKVCLISGGGSGHEPAHAGYVGKGMLTAAVCGGVFASPPTSAVLAGIKACSPSSVLLIVKNYTGDRLNFGKAAEMAKNEGINVEMVVIGEDTALTSKDKTAGRRGLCGTVFIHKIAGAMAENGRNLPDILRTVNQLKEGLGTISISLSPCSIPGQVASFQIPHNFFEFGLGIHGEPGVKKMELVSAKELVKLMVNHLLQSEYMPKLTGCSVSVIVNNLGGTSNLEMNIVTGELLKYLKVTGLKVDRCFVGAMMTSLEMAGVSVSILVNDSNTLQLLDQETEVIAWPKYGLVSDGHSCFLPQNEKQTNEQLEPVKVQTKMSRCIFFSLMNICDKLIANEDQLNHLDRVAGDGDCGTTFTRGAKSIREKLQDPNQVYLPINDPEKLALALADLVETSMGGSSGAILSLFLTAAAKNLKTTADNKAFFEAMIDGINAITVYGAAQEGDRTLLDALYPASRAFETRITGSFNDALKAAADAAVQGAKSTANMAAKAGRSSYVAAENLTEPDPGAVAIGLILEAIVESLN